MAENPTTANPEAEPGAEIMAENPTTANPVTTPKTGTTTDSNTSKRLLCDAELTPTENKNKKSRGAQVEAKVSPRIMMQAGAHYMLKMPEKERHFMEKLGGATKEGYDILKGGGKAVDAVERAVRILEKDKNFNAGRGSFLNQDGEVECDAMIMDGSTMKTGAVMAVRHFEQPVAICRKIMEHTPHCAFSADGALAFAQKNPELGLEICKPESLITEYAVQVIIDKPNFEEFVKEHISGNLPRRNDEPPPDSDTVSAIALDSEGRFACATSTGGLPGKAKGRISDAPLVGCGGYANKFGAATTSGHGEALMRMTLASRVVFNMEKLRQDAQTATSNAVQEMESCIDGRGCAIAIDKNGNFGKAANSSLIVWAKMADDKLEYGMDGRKTYPYNN